MKKCLLSVKAFLGGGGGGGGGGEGGCMTGRVRPEG